MKKLLLTSLILGCTIFVSFAQKYALVDMEYILKNIPNYEMMNEQLESVSKKWEQEVSKLQKEAQTLYKKYQSDLVFLSPKQKKEKEDEVIKKEQEAAELKTKYFGPEGELYQKRTEMMKPIQDEIWQAIKEIAKANNFQLVLDRGTSGIIFANPSIDISDQVLQKMGYSK